MSLSAQNLVHWALAAAVLLLVAPLWLVAIPGMPDFPAHLVSFQMIAAGDQTMPWSVYYHIHWLPVPNLAAELVVPLLMQFLPAMAATKLFLSIAVMLWASAPAAMQYALHRRIDAMALIGALFAYNAPFIWGFCNFAFASGAALWLYALWIARTEQRRLIDLAAFAGCFVVLYLCHLFAMLAALLMIGGYEIGRAWRDRAFSPTALMRRAGAVLVAATPAIALFFFLRTPGAGESKVLFDILDTLEDRADSAIMAYFDQPALMLIGLVAGLWCAGLLFKALRLPVATIPPIVFLALAALFAPEWAMGGWGVHMRLPAMLGSAMFGAVALNIDAKRNIALAGGGLVAVALMAGLLTNDWMGYSRQHTEFRAALKILPKGVKLFAAIDEASLVTESDQPYWHAADFAIADRGAFTPLMFATKGQHIVQINPPFDAMAAQGAKDGSPPDVSELNDLARVRLDLNPDIAVEYPYLERFPCRFDAVAVFRGSGVPSPVPAYLIPRHQGSFFTLYAIDRAEGCR